MPNDSGTPLNQEVEWLRAKLALVEQDQSSIGNKKPTIYEMIIKSAEVAIAGLSPEGLVLSWNHAAERLLEAPKNLAHGRFLTDFATGELAQAIPNFLQHLRQGVPVERMAGVLVSATGRKIDASLTFSPIRSTNKGTILGISVFMQETWEASNVARSRENELMYRKLFETSFDPILVQSPKGQVLDCNLAACEAFGYSHDEFVTLNDAQLIVLDPEKEKLPTLSRKLKTGIVVEEIECRRKDGSQFTAETHSWLARLGGEPIAFIHLRDITLRRQVQDQLERQEREFRTLAENSLDLIARFDRELRHQYVNPAYEKVTGIPRDQFAGKSRGEVGLPDEETVRWESHLRGVFRTGNSATMEFQHSGPNGTSYFESLLVPETDMLGQVQSVLVVSRDITERRRSERNLRESQTKLEEMNQRLQRLATVDSLTGLANRRLFDEKIDDEWRRSIRWQTPLALVMIDVDHFKLYNDSEGHMAGDQCLRRVANAIRSAVRRSTDFVARYGGEELAVLLAGETLEGGQVVAENIRRSVEKINIPHPKSMTTDHVTISLGVNAVMPGKACSLSEFIEGADESLYKAKSAGRNQVYPPLPPLDPDHPMRRRWDSESSAEVEFDATTGEQLTSEEEADLF